MPDNDNIAAENNYSGAAFQAEGALNPAISSADTSPEKVNDDTLKPSEQTDYRSVDNGLTSIGATDQNADMSTAGGLSTPGVRIGDDVPGVQTGGVGTQGPDADRIVNGTADPMAGGETDDKVGGGVLNDTAHGN